MGRPVGEDRGTAGPPVSVGNHFAIAVVEALYVVMFIYGHFQQRRLVYHQGECVEASLVRLYQFAGDTSA